MNFENMCFHIPHILLFFAKTLFLATRPSSRPSSRLFSCACAVLLAVALSLLNQLNIALSLREPEIDDWDIDEWEFDVEEQYRGPENGNAVRKHITNTFF